VNLETSRYSEGVVLDPRRAVWLPVSACLAVADLHLGRAWVERARGGLAPVDLPDDAPERLAALVAEYRPRRIAVLGDVVHAALEIGALADPLRQLVGLAGDATLTLCLGNHDRRLPELLARLGIPAESTPLLELPEAVLFHGDRDPGIADNDTRPRIQGHEHPALRLGDGVATNAKVPCFVAGRRALVLPAFSDLVAGCVVGRDGFLGPPARKI
jgi:putative SbcD/Mre11-related phosphoesterase